MRYEAIRPADAKHVREAAYVLRVERYYASTGPAESRYLKRASHRAMRRDGRVRIAEGMEK